jgi:hypothetical protein
VAAVEGHASAYVGHSGIAVTHSGLARAGLKGIAICDHDKFGSAEVEEGGVAIGIGEGSFDATAGHAGAAINAGRGSVVAGNDGVAIGSYLVGVSVGANGIAVAKEDCPEGGPGALLVCRWRDGQFRTAIVGPDGAVPEDFRAWVAVRQSEQAAEFAARWPAEPKEDGEAL